jgi:HK97 family phage major capsid protein
VVFDYLLGYPVWVNNDMAVPAANAKSMVFGNLKLLQDPRRDGRDDVPVHGLGVHQARPGGFLAWARMGGNLIDTAAVKYYQHSAT